ncbi:MAG: hypothetical protein KDK02_00135 [Rhodobacteraceae bacterium]|nr:hypothetical protein [Paracoccaceae bacterium]
MHDTVLATTSSDGLQPLGTAAQRSYELVSGAVRARLGPEHAAIFAEPVASEHGERIDWHTAIPGQSRPLADLPEPERDALRNRLAALAADIRAEAEALAGTGQADDRRLSEALLNALEIPGEAMIRAVQGGDGRLHPVLLHWAWIRNEQAAVRGILSGLVARPSGPPGAATMPARRRAWGWLIVPGWLLLAAMLGAILWLLVAPCGLNPAGPDYCPGETPPLAAADAEQRVIADRIGALERALALAARECQPTIPILPGPDKRGDAENDPQVIGSRLAARGAALGAMNFVLEWQGEADLALSVTCPGGETLSPDSPAACGGRLDPAARADAGAAPDGTRAAHMENIVFSEAKPGIYKVRVTARDVRGGAGTPLVLHVLREGRATRRHGGEVTGDGTGWTVNLSISR